MFGFGMWSWLQGIGNLLLHQVDRLLVASLLSTSALAYYAVGMQLAQQLHILSSRAVSFTFPLASAVQASGDLGRLRRICYKGSVFTVVVAVGLGAPFFVLAEPILALWMGSEFAAASAGVFRLQILFFTALATTIVPHFFLNGQEVQKSGTDLLIYSVPQIIAFCSDFTPLVPGDVIATGTPEGVGHRRNPPLWMKPGDVLEVEISSIGTLRNRVVDEK